MRAARERKNLTQVQVAARAGISLVTLAQAEKFGALTERTAEKLAPVLGVDAEDLLP